MMAGVIRRDPNMMGAKAIPGYAFHGVTAILVLFLLFRAMGS
jgi:hypothetical protein